MREPLSQINTLGPVCAFGASVTWAIGSSGYSRLASKYNPFTVNCTRAMVALPLFILAGIFQAGSLSLFAESLHQITWHHFGWFFLSMLASYGIGDIVFLKSSQILGVPGALAIASCFPVWTVLIGIWQGDTLRVLQIFGLLLTVAGVVLVVLHSPHRGKEQAHLRPVAVGVVLALLASMLWALNGWSVSKGGIGISPLTANIIRMAFSFIFVAGLMRTFIVKQSVFLPRVEMKQYWWIFLIEAFGGSLFFVYGLAHSPLAMGSTLSSLAPVLAVPVAWILGLEAVSFLRTVGVFLVVGGLSLLVGLFSI